MSEIEKQFFETFDIPKIFKTTINVGDLDMNYKEIQAPTLEELYEEARYDMDTPIYFSWFKHSKRWSEEYPEITDMLYLKMLAFLTCCDDEQYDWRNLSELRKTILEDIIDRYSFETHIQNDYSMKEFIQELFKENN